MHAIVVREYGGPEVLSWEECRDPVPGPGELLISVQAAGVNPVDVSFRSGGSHAWPLPFVPGFDGAGVVEEVGPEVRRFRRGDRVYFSLWGRTGSYAERVVCREEEAEPLGEALDFAQGAAVGIPCGTAYRALFLRAEASAGDVVLVHGASGSVGLAAIQLARAAGLTVIGTAGGEEGRKLVAREGAHHVLDHRSPDHFRQILEITRGKGVEIVLEMLANVNLGKDFDVTALGGKVVVIGSRGLVEIDPRGLISRDLSILGMSLFCASPKERKIIAAALAAHLAKGLLRPVIRTVLPMSSADQAQRLVMEPGASGKVVLVPPT
ncbi:2-haloacrylate reductase [Methylacidimicrobium cyclopophantes]|uniref:2-haloacrylate reductase n=1 Tax=Methylacidimicrobium cyclopophantes TaxID=1041766 RepID=A0A5E6MRD9_9BACT|nr:NADPH:quinone reductase [Methylacidimicrobium cyclopophantes]VVM08448.1 2-haloacrylate reductase [Methylacidimicrobium cyclopophantes]